MTCALTVNLLIILTATHLFAQSKAADQNAKYRFAINFNETMNRCLQTNCANIDEVMSFFADDATYLDDAGQTWKGKTKIKMHLVQASSVAGTADRIASIYVEDAMITCRLERRRAFKSGKYDVAEVRPHLRAIILKSGLITRLISVIPSEDK
jgi:ketosteroid isomerase-like protein